MANTTIQELEEQYQKDLKKAEDHCTEIAKRYTGHNMYDSMERSKAYNALNAVKASYQRKIKNHSKIVPILRKAGLPIAKSTTTAIKGHRDWSLGFKVSSDLDGVRIYFQKQGYESLGTYRELTVAQKALAAKVLVNAGYDIRATNNEITILSFNWDK